MLSHTAEYALRTVLYIAEHGDDMPQISGWHWGPESLGSKTETSTEGDNV